MRNRCGSPVGVAWFAEPADGQVRQLRAEGDRIQHRSAPRHRIEQIDALPLLGEVEAGVVSGGAIRIVRQHDQVTSGWNAGARRKDILARIARIIAQPHSSQVRSRSARVVEFDAVRSRPGVRI